MRVRIGLAVVAVGAAVGLAACGGGSGGGSGTQAASPSPSSSAHAPSTAQQPAPASSTAQQKTPASSTARGSTSAAAATIRIKNFAYQVSGPVHAGTTVMVHNADDVAHTVTANHGNAFNVTVQPGKTKKFTAPNKAGTYPFHCNFHANMHGKLVVR
jgi:plastocyanin